MIVALFEDEAYRNFLPLTYTRPMFECRTGMHSFLERAEKTFPESHLFLFTRDYLTATLKKRVTHVVNKPDKIDEDILLINGTLIADEIVKKLVRKKLKSNAVIMQNGRIALAHLREDLAKKHSAELTKPVTQSFIRKLSRKCSVLKSKELRFFNYPWELVNSCGELVEEDYAGLGRLESEGSIDTHVAVYGEIEKVYVSEGAVIEAFVTLDARTGPTYIGKNAYVHSGSRITGPAYIGDKTVVASALIREGCSIGTVSHVGGELEQTIVQGYSNKYHNGFLGHVYIGEWVNLGAGTNNSDLKNTYGNVQVTTARKKVDTSCAKVGSFIGDHVKMSIGTLISTGKTIGVASHVHGFVADDVPSFTIWAKSLNANPVELKLESAIKTQERVFARRGVKQTQEDVALLRKVFEMTADERKKAGVSKGEFSF
jgi:UDP-N-acetylglucosamine diphosphorylase/glucosamine-1-phosphate N-acetyltransferase